MPSYKLGPKEFLYDLLDNFEMTELKEEKVIDSGDLNGTFGDNDSPITGQPNSDKSSLSASQLPNDLDLDSVKSDKPRGIRRAEIIAQQYGNKGKFMVFFFIFLVAYAYGLDSNTRYVFQATATSSYGSHSLLSTVNVIRSVIAAAAQPTYARLSDVFGRTELLIVAVLFFVVGTIIESQAYDVEKFAGGAILYQIGYTGIVLLLQLVIGDLSLLNWRLLCSFVPALPFIINTWISGNVTGAIGDNWSWGIGMWAIILPVVSIPLIVSLYHMEWRAKKSGQFVELEGELSDYRRLGLWKFLVDLFWKLDVIGIILLVAVFALILVPFTLAGGVKSEWAKAKIIVPLVIGFCLIPVFVYWQAKSPHPIAPLHLLKDRGIWAALCIGILFDFIWYMQGDFMYTILVVSVNQSITSATRITSLYSFVSVITGTLLGFVVIKVRRLKPFILFGTSIWVLAMGLLIKFRGGDTSKAGIIGSLCLLGFGAGFFTYPTQASVQSCTKHEHMGVVTALYLASFNIGAAVGAAVSGAVWTQVLPGQILKDLGGDTVLADEAYGSPFTFIVTYTWDTPERQAVVQSYKHTQKILIVIGVCLCIPLIVLAFLLRDHKLQSKQSLDEAEEYVKEKRSWKNLWLV